MGTLHQSRFEGASLAAADVAARSEGCGDLCIHADLAVQLMLILHFLHFQLHGFHVGLQDIENSHLRLHHSAAAAALPDPPPPFSQQLRSLVL